MTKNPSPPDSDPLTHYELYKRHKIWNPLEHSLPIAAFILVTLFFLGCLFFLDYQAATTNNALRYCGLSHLGLKPPSSPEATLGRNERLEFHDEFGHDCSVFDGNWIWDYSNYPLYQSKDCPFIDEEFRCSGRPDHLYTNWRWQPKGCNLPRFDTSKLLEKLRNRRLAFVGDSLGRNQWESLLCMLTSTIPDKDSVYEVNGSEITKYKAFLGFMFTDYNCTVEYYRSPFLVHQGRPPTGAPEEVKTTLKVDELMPVSEQWRDADVLIFNTGHWWNHDKTIGSGCYFQEGEEVNMNMTIETAFKRSIETLIDWIGNEVDMSKTQVLFRTYSPSHYRNGDWKSGGYCNLDRLPDPDTSTRTSEEHVDWFFEVLTKRSNEPQVMNLGLLDAMNISVARKDGHPSLYYPYSGKRPLHQDCNHWCLPGVPDSWNEVLYSLLLRC